MKLETKQEKLLRWLQHQPPPFNCQKCGGFHRATLEFHFKDRSKDISIIEMLEQGLTVRKVNSMMKKSKILCANCHRKFHWGEKS